MVQQSRLYSLDIINARVPGYEGFQRIRIGDRGTLVAVQPMSVEVTPMGLVHSLDVDGDWVSLGGVDLQINGALGLAFPDLTLQQTEKLEEIGQFLGSQGVSGYLPTLVTTSVENIQRALAAIAPEVRSPQPEDEPTAQILGVHLEGPFLNPDKRGAHPAEYLLPLTLDQVKRVLGDYADVVKIMTLAPELDPTGEVIPYLRSQGITVSLGHSQATAEQAQAAFTQGATMVTHTFNAMPALHHRQPGLLGAALVDPRVQCGLIADGQHVCPTMLEIVLRASHYDAGLFLVSDALSPLGLPDGRYPWDVREIEVTQGTARLPDGTLAGTTLPLLAGAQNLVQWGLCEVEQAIALATTAPRCALGLAPSPQAAYIHEPAHLLRWRYVPENRLLTWERLSA
jgi:N-acetylglucosamine-6-phosphate deacetylase